MADNQILNMAPSLSGHQEELQGLSLQQHRFANVDKILPKLRYSIFPQTFIVFSTY